MHKFIKDPIETAQCPVCRALLGKRDKREFFTVHCAECRATFSWRPWVEKPSAKLDKDVPITCGCGGCGR